jgi:hypothetical protein
MSRIRKIHSYDIFLTARREGWSEEVRRLTAYGDRLTTYRKNGRTIRVETGHGGGGVKWCDRFEGEDRKYYVHLNSQVPNKATSVVHWMTESWD